MKKGFSVLLGIIVVFSLSFQLPVSAAPSFVEVRETETNDSFTEANAFELNDTVFGQVDGQDQDYYLVNVFYPGNFELYGFGWDNIGVEENYEGLVFSLYDDEGNLISESDYYPPDEDMDDGDINFIGAILSPGTYYIGVKNTNDEVEDYEFYTDFYVGLERLAGDTRYSTAVTISQAGWETSDYAVLTTGGNFPDALSATPLAAKYEAPLLLAQPNRKTLTPEVKEELQRLEVREVFVVGGTGAVSADVATELTKMGIKVTRIAGADRYETAVKVAQKVGNYGEIAVATGTNFADALSMSSVAAAQGMPILLTKPNELPISVKNYLKSNAVKKTFVIGGTGAVSEPVKKSLPGSERISGIDRYATNKAIIDRFKADIDFTFSFVATGVNYPDALSGSALAAGFYSPIILTKAVPTEPTYNIIREYDKSIGVLVALGGTGAVPVQTMNDLMAWTNPNLTKAFEE